jgi:hypothetical protein
MVLFRSTNLAAAGSILRGKSARIGGQSEFLYWRF